MGSVRREGGGKDERRNGKCEEGGRRKGGMRSVRREGVEGR
jgi:hypothetical protein